MPSTEVRWIIGTILAVAVIIIGGFTMVNIRIGDLAATVAELRDDMREDHRGFDNRLRAVEIGFGKVDQRLETPTSRSSTSAAPAEPSTPTWNGGPARCCSRTAPFSGQWRAHYHVDLHLCRSDLAVTVCSTMPGIYAAEVRPGSGRATTSRSST